MDVFSIAGNWSPQEHENFLRGLEQFGQAEGLAQAEVWKKISSVVGTKSAADVKKHAHNYFIKLQAESYTSNVAPSNVAMAMGGLARWSLEEEFVFEAALASAYRSDYNEHESSSSSSSTGFSRVDYVAIAQLLPGKTAADIEHRYHLLLDDIAKIEEGEDVAVVYYGVQGAHGPPKTPNAKGRLQYIQGLIAQHQNSQNPAPKISLDGSITSRRPDMSPDKKMKLV